MPTESSGEISRRGGNPLQPDSSDPGRGAQPFFDRREARRGDAVGMAPPFRRQGLYESSGLELREAAVQGAGAER